MFVYYAHFLKQQIKLVKNKKGNNSVILKKPNLNNKIC